MGIKGRVWVQEENTSETPGAVARLEQNTKCGEKLCVRLPHSCGFLLVMLHPPLRLLFRAPKGPLKPLSVSVRDA